MCIEASSFILQTNAVLLSRFTMFCSLTYSPYLWFCTMSLVWNPGNHTKHDTPMNRNTHKPGPHPERRIDKCTTTVHGPLSRPTILIVIQGGFPPGMFACWPCWCYRCCLCLGAAQCVRSAAVSSSSS